MKFIYSTRATRGYQKHGIFTKIRRRRFREIKDFGIERLPTCAITLQEVGILPTLVLVPIFGLIFGLKMVEYVKGLFGQKKAQNPTFFA